MLKPLRILIVEDEPEMRAHLKTIYSRVFQEHAFQPEFDEAEDATKALDDAQKAASKPYDLVSLDVNLRDKTVTGLDVLGAFKQFKSAWMVALLTGIEMDASLDAVVGNERAEQMRRGLRSEAYTKFWPERLIVVEKPVSSLQQDQAKTLLDNRLEQIALVYEIVTRERYVFRAVTLPAIRRMEKGGRILIETEITKYQIRCGCGDLVTVDFYAGIKVMHELFKKGRSGIINASEAKTIEPPQKRKSSTVKAEPTSTSVPDQLVSFFRDKHPNWQTLGREHQLNLMEASLGGKIDRFVELMKYRDTGAIQTSEEKELEEIVANYGLLGPIADAYYVQTKEHDVDFRSALEVIFDGQGHLAPLREPEDADDARLRKLESRLRFYLEENGCMGFSHYLRDHVSTKKFRGGEEQLIHDQPPIVEWTTS